MFKNYLLIAIRNLLRQKGFSAISIIGLGVGMACFILIFLWVRHELSYDKFNEKADCLYRLVQTQHYSSGPLTTTCMPGLIAKDLKKDFPEITGSFMYYVIDGIISSGDKVFSEDLRLADPELFSMFTFTFQAGDPGSVFNDLNSIVITDKMARKYFGNNHPIGKVLTINGEHTFKVTGVINETPTNSSFRFDFCIPFDYIEHFGFKINDYGWNTYYCYVELLPGVDYQNVNLKIKDYLMLKTYDASTFSTDASISPVDLFLFPLKKMHLYSFGAHVGDIRYVYIFSLIAIFILIIACINFMNLSTARAARRSREIGLRKTSGAGRRQIIIQFLGESFLITFIAFIISIILIYFFLPAFNLLAGKSLIFEWWQPDLSFTLVGIMIITSILAGSYPAFYLSSLNPVNSLRKLYVSGKSRAGFRRILVVFQFSLSVIMIICTLVVYKQLAYFKSRDTGMNRKNIISIAMQGKSIEKYELLKNDWKQNPAIIHITRSNEYPFMIGSNSGGFDWESRDTKDEVLIGFVFTDFGYTKTFGMKLLSGRDFDPSFSTDSSSIIINQCTARLLGIKDPVGKWMKWNDVKFTIIGVVEDFQFLDMTNEISPLVMLYKPEYCNLMFARLTGIDPEQVIGYMQDNWEKANLGFPFEYKWLEASYEELYRSEEKLGNIFRYFSILTIFISCLGLFGLAAFIAEERTKEVGIRKVLGADFYDIFRTIASGFVKWIILANLIACPVAYYFMNQWLTGYAYHTRLSIWIFLSTALISLFIAMLTVSYQVVRTARQRPVISLKYE